MNKDQFNLIQLDLFGNKEVKEIIYNDYEWHNQVDTIKNIQSTNYSVIDKKINRINK